MPSPQVGWQFFVVYVPTPASSRTRSSTASLCPQVCLAAVYLPRFAWCCIPVPTGSAESPRFVSSCLHGCMPLVNCAVPAAPANVVFFCSEQDSHNSGTPSCFAFPLGVLQASATSRPTPWTLAHRRALCDSNLELFLFRLAGKRNEPPYSMDANLLHISYEG